MSRLGAVPMGVRGVSPSEMGVHSLVQAPAPRTSVAPMPEISPRPWVESLPAPVVMPIPDEEELRRRREQELSRARLATFLPTPDSGNEGLAKVRLRRSLHPNHAGGMEI